MQASRKSARIVLEKPIGRDLASACELGRTVREVFDEPQVFRIDHYLGKEAVRNILVFRFANSMVERAWCGEAVDHEIATAPPVDRMAHAPALARQAVERPPHRRLGFGAHATSRGKTQRDGWRA